MPQLSPPERLGWKQMAYGQSLVLCQAGPRLIGFAIRRIFALVIVEFNNMRAAARLIGSYVLEGPLQSHMMLICIRSRRIESCRWHCFNALYAISQISANRSRVMWGLSATRDKTTPMFRRNFW